jgi:hypothetical protein
MLLFFCYARLAKQGVFAPQKKAFGLRSKKTSKAGMQEAEQKMQRIALFFASLLACLPCFAWRQARRLASLHLRCSHAQQG